MSGPNGPMSSKYTDFPVILKVKRNHGYSKEELQLSEPDRPGGGRWRVDARPPGQAQIFKQFHFGIPAEATRG